MIPSTLVSLSISFGLFAGITTALPPSKPIPTIAPASIGYPGAMSGIMDSDMSQDTTGCVYPHRADNMWMTWPRALWDNGSYCGLCMALYATDRATGQPSGPVYVQVNSANSALASNDPRVDNPSSVMDTSSYALGLLLGKFGLGQADPSHWEFVSCVDAGLEEGKLQFFWGSTSNGALASIQVRGAALPIQYLYYMKPDSCDWELLERSAAWFTLHYSGPGPFSFKSVYRDGTYTITENIALRSQIGGDKGLWYGNSTDATQNTA